MIQSSTVSLAGQHTAEAAEHHAVEVRLHAVEVRLLLHRFHLRSPCSAAADEREEITESLGDPDISEHGLLDKA